MRRPFPGTASDSSEGVLGESVGVPGLEIVDSALAESLRTGMAEVETVLHEAVRSDFQFATRTSLHLVDAGGKRFRPLFTLLAAQFGDPSRFGVVRSAAILEMVHMATLYHDDVMDEATMRRGASSANARWDNSIAILAGDFLFAQASRLVADLGAEAVRTMATTFEELVTGQMRETIGAAEGEDRIEHYLTVIYEKTGTLIALAARFGAQFAGADPTHVEALARIGTNVGIAFQISDDIIDIASPAVESGKSPGTDLREGVLTLPMLHALADPDVSPRLRTLLSGPVATDAEVDEALLLLRESAGMTRSREVLTGYADTVHRELVALPDCPARDALASLMEYVVARTR